MKNNNLFTGLFFSFEGIDGAGKSTHIKYFHEQLVKIFPDKRVILTREPGGTDLGESLRELLLHKSMNIETEALLMFAARREHLAQVIEPALMNGDIVISDRFTDASFAYQCGGRGLNREKMFILERWVQGRNINNETECIEPNLTFLFDLSIEIAQSRREQARTPDKFEVLDTIFFENVRNEYLRRAENDPDRFMIIDSNKSINEIRLDLHEILMQIVVN